MFGVHPLRVLPSFEPLLRIKDPSYPSKSYAGTEAGIVILVHVNKIPGSILQGEIGTEELHPCYHQAWLLPSRRGIVSIPLIIGLLNLHIGPAHATIVKRFWFCQAGILAVNVPFCRECWGGEILFSLVKAKCQAREYVTCDVRVVFSVVYKMCLRCSKRLYPSLPMDRRYNCSHSITTAERPCLSAFATGNAEDLVHSLWPAQTTSCASS